MLHATVAPAHLPLHAGALAHAVVRLMSADVCLVPPDAHAGGDPTLASFTYHVATVAPMGTVSTCAHFLRRLMLQHEAPLQHSLKQVKHLQHPDKTLASYVRNI